MPSLFFGRDESPAPTKEEHHALLMKLAHANPRRFSPAIMAARMLAWKNAQDAEDVRGMRTLIEKAKRDLRAQKEE